MGLDSLIILELKIIYFILAALNPLITSLVLKARAKHHGVDVSRCMLVVLSRVFRRASERDFAPLRVLRQLLCCALWQTFAAHRVAVDVDSGQSQGKFFQRLFHQRFSWRQALCARAWHFALCRFAGKALWRIRRQPRGSSWDMARWGNASAGMAGTRACLAWDWSRHLHRSTPDSGWTRRCRQCGGCRPGVTKPCRVTSVLPPSDFTNAPNGCRRNNRVHPSTGSG
jgi:hypothetical protein